MYHCSALAADPVHDSFGVHELSSQYGIAYLACRKGFLHVLATSNQALARIQEAGPDATLDMDNLLLRQSLDVIGLVGFEQDMGGTRSLDDSSEASNCLVISVTAMQEIERRFRDPFRGRKFWRKVSCPSLVLWRLCI